jgi:hypothetical protein
MLICGSRVKRVDWSEIKVDLMLLEGRVWRKTAWIMLLVSSFLSSFRFRSKKIF